MKYLLDCDPGHDDTVMILFALRTLDVVGLTTVAGNQAVEKVTANALHILELAGRSDLPVGKGAARSLLNSTCFAPELHGESGLGGFTFGELRTSPKGSALDLMRHALEGRDPITVVATGPLTNLALLLVDEPKLAMRIAKISLMGGSTGLGNMTTHAEFNVFVDPEAADVVFGSGIPIDMYGLNATAQVPLRDDLVQALRYQCTRVSTPLCALLDFYLCATAQHSGRREANLHDLCAAVGLVRPDMFEFRSMYVRVELHGELTRAMTVCDSRFGVTPQEAAETPSRLRPATLGHGPNAQVAVRANGDSINTLLLEVLGSYS